MLNNNLPLVSICVPIYNIEPYISKCLDSILNQDYANIEILIYYDKSKDNTLEIVKKKLSESSFPNKIIEKDESEKGQGISRNMAIKDANGEYLYFLDGDDYIEANAISTLVKKADLYNADITCGSHQIIYENGETGAKFQHENHVFTDNDLFLNYVYVSHSYYSQYAWNKLYRLSFLRNNNIKCIHKIVEDYIFSFDVIRYARHIVLTNDILLHYLIRSSSTTAQEMSKSVSTDTAQIYLSIRDYILNAISVMKDSPIRINILMQVLYFSFVMTVRDSLNSPIISPEIKRHLCHSIVTFPSLQTMFNISLSKEMQKYRAVFVLLKCFPIKLRIFVVRILSRIIFIKNKH